MLLKGDREIPIVRKNLKSKDFEKKFKKIWVQKIRVAMLPLITEMSVETQFPELNQLLFKGILTFAQRALRQCKVTK